MDTVSGEGDGALSNRGLALVRMGGEGAHGEGGLNMIGDGELNPGFAFRGCAGGCRGLL